MMMLSVQNISFWTARQFLEWHWPHAILTLSTILLLAAKEHCTACYGKHNCGDILQTVLTFAKDVKKSPWPHGTRLSRKRQRPGNPLLSSSQSYVLHVMQYFLQALYSKDFVLCLGGALSSAPRWRHGAFSMKTGMCLATENEGSFLTCQFQVQGALMAQQLLTEGVSSLISVMPKNSAGFILFIPHFME